MEVQCPEALFPVGVPDEGTFDWLDEFLQKKENRRYVEISYRQLLRLAKASGVERSHGYDWRCTRNWPDMSCGIPLLDELSLDKFLAMVAPTLSQDVIVMDVIGNLDAEVRRKRLQSLAGFKRCARVVVGEPPADFKLKVQEALLEEKRSRSATDNGSREDEGAGGGDSAAAPASSSDAALSEEESQRWFRKHEVSDLTPKEMRGFQSFTLPTRSEGFDEISFEWQPEAQAQAYLKSWVSGRKNFEFVEELQPSEWFGDMWARWTKSLAAWRKKQETMASRKKIAQARAVAAAPAAQAAGAAKANLKAPAAAKQEDDSDDDAWGDWKGEPEEEAAPKEEETKEDEKEDEEKEHAGHDGDVKSEAQDTPQSSEVAVKASDGPVDIMEVDLFAVEDIDDIGDGELMYKHFSQEDWMLVSLRAELHLLLHAFRRDVNDPERTGFHEKHFDHYYSLYCRGRHFSLAAYGAKAVGDLVALVHDTIELTKPGMQLEALHPAETPFHNFVRLAEEERRNRQCAIDSGDSSAALKFTASAYAMRAASYQTAARSAGQQSRPQSNNGQSYGNSAGGGGPQKKEANNSNNSMSKDTGGRKRDRGKKDGRSGGGGGGRSSRTEHRPPPEMYPPPPHHLMGPWMAMMPPGHMPPPGHFMPPPPPGNFVPCPLPGAPFGPPPPGHFGMPGAPPPPHGPPPPGVLSASDQAPVASKARPRTRTADAKSSPPAAAKAPKPTAGCRVGGPAAPSPKPSAGGPAAAKRPMPPASAPPSKKPRLVLGSAPERPMPSSATGSTPAKARPGSAYARASYGGR